MTITEADLAKCHMVETGHFHGTDRFGYVHRCVQHLRLTRVDTYLRKDRSVHSEWRVDDKRVANLAEAAERLSVPYQPTAEDLALLALITDEFVLHEDRFKFRHLAVVGLIEFKDGKCRLTDTGRAAKEGTVL